MKEWEKFTHRIAKYLAPYRSQVTITFLLALVVAVLGVLEPLVLKYFIDEIMIGENNISSTVLITAGSFLVISLAKEVLGGVQNWLAWKVRMNFQLSLQAETTEKLCSLPIAFHQKEGVGATMAKFDRAINSFVNSFYDIAFQLGPAVVYLVICIVVMLELNWQLLLLVLFFLPLPAVIGAMASKEQTIREKYLIEAWSKIYGRFYEVLACILTVKSYAKETSETQLFTSNIAKTNQRVLVGVKTDTIVNSLKNLIVVISRVVAISFGAFLIYNDKITVGTLVAFLGYIGNLFGPVQGLTNVYQTYRRALVSLDILDSVFKAEDHLADVPGANDLKDVEGEVVFENVNFEYPNREPVISNLNLRVNAGETVAIVGPSGVGKSTLMSLVLRLNNPSTGLIKIDGKDIRLLKLNSIRRHVGIVLQEPLLFNDTVRNNIAYGMVYANQEEVERAAKLANAHDFIMQLPLKYDTIVGEKGNNLSGGQRQRIAIARAILKDPAILILDEATSALDADTEGLVQQAFKQLVKGRTTFVISHRMANIVDADRIVVLRDGQIYKIITPQESIEQENLYAYS